MVCSRASRVPGAAHVVSYVSQFAREAPRLDSVGEAYQAGEADAAGDNRCGCAEKQRHQPQGCEQDHTDQHRIAGDDERHLEM